MKMLEFKKGDSCWIYMSGHEGKLTKGKVLEVLDLFEHGYTHLNYLIEIETGIDTMLEVRHGFTMSDNPEGPIGLWRK